MTYSSTTHDARKTAASAAGQEVFFNRAAAALLTALLLWGCTLLLQELRVLTHAQRPYTILYLIPVALGAALLGVRGGVLSALAALVLARALLFNDQHHGLALFRSLPTVPEGIEFLSLAVGTLTIAAVTGSLRQAMVALRAAHVRLLDSEQQRRLFNRDVLLAVTGGKLQLVEPDEMPYPDLRLDKPALILPLDQPRDVGHLRHEIERLVALGGMEPGRVDDLATSVTEAATNAIKHGGGGTARVRVDSVGVWVEIQDHGLGIAPAHLARATLEAGYSTRVSLGMGFHMMLQTADSLSLCTSESGTTVFLHVANRPRATDQETLLARYVGL